MTCRSAGFQPGVVISSCGLLRNPSGSAHHIAFFEACSAFTYVTACLFARSHNDPLHQRLRRLRCLRRRSDCYRLERPFAGRVSTPAEEQRLSRRTGFLRHGSGVRKGCCCRKEPADFRPRAHALAARRRVRLFLVGLLPSRAQLRFTGLGDRKPLTIHKQCLRTPESCLKKSICGASNRPLTTLQPDEPENISERWSPCLKNPKLHRREATSKIFAGKQETRGYQ